MGTYQKKPRLAAFGDNLRKLIEAADVTQTELANDLGVSSVTVNSWVNNKFEPPLWEICRLCAYFESTPNELLGFMKTQGQELRRLGIYDDLKIWKLKKKRRAKNNKHGVAMAK